MVGFAAAECAYSFQRLLFVVVSKRGPSNPGMANVCDMAEVEEDHVSRRHYLGRKQFNRLPFEHLDTHLDFQVLVLPHLDYPHAVFR